MFGRPRIEVQKGDRYGIYTALKFSHVNIKGECVWEWQCEKCNRILLRKVTGLKSNKILQCLHNPKPKWERKITEGYIYVIKVNEYFKIGKSTDIKTRIKRYITENPYEIKVIIFKKVKDHTKTENYLLKRFKNKKHKNEWFLLDDNDLVSIKNYLELKEGFCI